jgi:hypothetical protein
MFETRAWIEFAEATSFLSKMGFQLVEQGGAFSLPLQPEVALHAEVESIPAKTERLQKREEKVTKPRRKIGFRIATL